MTKRKTVEAPDPLAALPDPGVEAALPPNGSADQPTTKARKEKKPKRTGRVWVEGAAMYAQGDDVTLSGFSDEVCQRYGIKGIEGVREGVCNIGTPTVIKFKTPKHAADFHDCQFNAGTDDEEHGAVPEYIDTGSATEWTLGETSFSR